MAYIRSGYIVEDLVVWVPLKANGSASTRLSAIAATVELGN